MRARTWLVMACLALVGVLFLAVYPARSYLDQREKRREAATRLRVMQAENASLDEAVQRLHTDAEIERLARKDYNLVKPGEEVYAVAPTAPAAPPPPPPALETPPRSWPQRALDWVTGIL